MHDSSTYLTRACSNCLLIPRSQSLFDDNQRLGMSSTTCSKKSSGSALPGNRLNARPSSLPFPSSYPPSSTVSLSTSKTTSTSHPTSPSPSSALLDTQPQTKGRTRDIRQHTRNKSLLGRVIIPGPIPPSLLDSPLLQSPESVFRRPYPPNSRTPEKELEEDQWLGDTVPMHADSDNAQLPNSASGSLRRKDMPERNGAASCETKKATRGQTGKLPTAVPPSSSTSSSAAAPGTRPFASDR